jgi:hypothetical protein
VDSLWDRAIVYCNCPPGDSTSIHPCQHLFPYSVSCSTCIVCKSAPNGSLIKENRRGNRTGHLCILILKGSLVYVNLLLLVVIPRYLVTLQSQRGLSSNRDPRSYQPAPPFDSVTYLIGLCSKSPSDVTKMA